MWLNKNKSSFLSWFCFLGFVFWFFFFKEGWENNSLVFIDENLLIEKWEQVYSSFDISYLYSACSSCIEPSGSLHHAHSLFLGVKANSIWVGSNFPFREVCCLGKKPQCELSAVECFHWQDGLFPHFLGLRKQILNLFFFFCKDKMPTFNSWS